VLLLSIFSLYKLSLGLKVFIVAKAPKYYDKKRAWNFDNPN
jgi:hypothetical protein